MISTLVLGALTRLSCRYIESHAPRAVARAATFVIAAEHTHGPYLSLITTQPRDRPGSRGYMQSGFGHEGNLDNPNRYTAAKNVVTIEHGVAGFREYLRITSIASPTKV